MAYDTSLLDQALAHRRLLLEQERQALLSRVLALLDQRAAAFGIERAYVVGSLAAPGRFHEASDVDIAVEQIDPLRLFEALGEFSASLGRPVDIIQLDRCHFAERLRTKGIPWTSSNSLS